MEYNLYALKDEMVEHFNLNDLRDIYFYMGVDWEDTPGDETKSIRSIELLTNLKRHDRVPELINHLQNRMPNNDWNLIKSQLGQNKEFVESLGLNPQISTKFFEEKFELYREVWKNLHQLKVAGDVLWERASKENILNFTDLLMKTTNIVEINAILFDENEHYDLLNLLNEFGNFRQGKERLIEILRTRDESRIHINSSDIASQIKFNSDAKEDYEVLLTQICIRFRNRLNAWAMN